MGIHIWVVKILIINQFNIVQRNLKNKHNKIWQEIKGLLEDCILNVKKPNVFYHRLIRRLWNAKLCLKDMISTPPSRELNLKNYVQICLNSVYHLYKMFYKILVLVNHKLMKLFQLVVLQECLRYNRCCKITLMVNN